jgi:hypothetical protein
MWYNAAMEYHGTVRHGVMVFEGQLPLPDGTPVRVLSDTPAGRPPQSRGIARRMRGFLKISAPSPTDEEIDRLRFEALAEKHGLDLLAGLP